MTTVALFIMLFVFMFMGTPVAVALGLSSLLTILFFGTDSLASLSLKMYETSEHFTLMAIPFFVLAGSFMTTGGVAKRMIRSGYPKSFAAGVVCNAGTLGILIPPSIVMVVYGAATETSVGALFMAGVIPGISLGILLMIAIYIVARIKNYPRQPRASAQEVLAAGRDSIWGLALIFIILGGIYGGVFTPTEAAAVAAVYAFLVAVFVYRDIGFRQVPDVLIDAAKVTIMLMFIIVNALLFAHVLTTERIPQIIAEQIIAWDMQAWQFLIVVNILLLVAGMFMEPTGIILILAPILFPIAMQLGIDPVHLGIIMVVNLEIGMVTPPIGLNLFVTAGITKMSIGQVVRAASPWLILLLAFLVIITYVPAISLWLPQLLG